MAQYFDFAGSSGDYASTPDSVAMDITDLDVAIKLAEPDWTPAAHGGLVSKYSGGQRTFRFALRTSGKLRLDWSVDGSATLGAESSVATGVTDGEIKWVRCTLDVDNGASGYDLKFYTGDNGTDWVQLGSTTTGGATTSLFAGTADLLVAADSGGSSMVGTFNGYIARLYDSIGGSVAVEFNAGDFTVGEGDTDTAVSSATGETWTLHGTGVIVEDTPAAGTAKDRLLLGVG